jgi:hypothetical protein
MPVRPSDVTKSVVVLAVILLLLAVATQIFTISGTLTSLGVITPTPTPAPACAPAPALEPPVGTPIAAGTHAGVVLNDCTNTIDVFGCNGTQPSALTHNTFNNNKWSGWSALGGSFNYSPVAVSRSPGNVSVYVVGSDYAVWKTTCAVGYESWIGLGGNTHHGTACCSMLPTREDVFITDYSSGQVYQKYWNNGTWSGWVSLGSPNSTAANSGPGACTYASGQEAVFVQGNDGYTWWRYWNGCSWSAWASLGGAQVGSTNHPSACGYNGKIYLFSTTVDNATAYTIYNGSSWSAWTTVPGVIMTSSPEVQITPDGSTVHYFARGNDEAIWHRSYTTATGVWSAWETIGGTFP